MLVSIKMIQCCGRKGWVVLKFNGEEIDWVINFAEKVLYWIGNEGLVYGSIKLEFQT